MKRLAHHLLMKMAAAGGGAPGGWKTMGDVAAVSGLVFWNRVFVLLSAFEGLVIALLIRQQVVYSNNL